MSADLVQNLVHQQLWTGVEPASMYGFEFCRGKPPKQLHPDDQAIEDEYVLSSLANAQWSVEKWAQAFKTLQVHYKLEQEPRRIVMAMITDDSTIVYYLVHNGLQAPRKN